LFQVTPFFVKFVIFAFFVNYAYFVVFSFFFVEYFLTKPPDISVPRPQISMAGRKVQASRPAQRPEGLP